MKKVIKTILLGMLALIMGLGAFGCSCNEDEGWTETSIKEWGAIQSINGFVAQTEKNLYFINGQGQTTDDNTFGKVVKGSLMGISKAEFLAGNLDKAEIVVPKLFTSSDYKAGIYIYGDYVYYGTPSTDKNADGDIANTEMVITKSKLDGTDTVELFKTTSNATQFRVLEKGGKIYVVYYDDADKAIKEYADGETKTLVKTDETTNEEGYQSLAEYRFVDNAGWADTALVFTTTVYSEEYFENKAENTSDYSRATASYNKLYSYSAGEVKLILDGKDAKNDVKYTINSITAGYIFYTATDVNSVAKTYAVKINEVADLTKHVELNASASSNLTDTTLIVSLDEVYVVNATSSDSSSEEETATTGDVYRTTLVGEEALVKEKVVLVTTVKKLLFKLGDNLYYANAADNIMRIKIGDADAKEVQITDSTYANSWYAPTVVTVDGKNFLFYCDNSATGCYYTTFVCLDNEVVGEDSDDDGENDLFFLSGNKALAIKIDADMAKAIEGMITDIYEDGKIKIHEIETGIWFKEYDDAKWVYDNASDAVKELVSEESVKSLNNAGRGVELIREYHKLVNVEKYASLTDAEKMDIKAAYESIKEMKTQLDESEDYDLATILGFIDNNYKWYFQKANELFAESE